MKTGFLLIVSFIFSLFSYSQVDSVLYKNEKYFIYPHAAFELHLKVPFYDGLVFEQSLETDSLDSGLKRMVLLPFKMQFPPEHAEKGILTRYKNELPHIYDKIWISWDQDLAPIYDPIPDGRYMQYFKRMPYRDGDTLKYRYDGIACVFSIKNNLPHGFACWLSANGDTILCGNYENGLKQGQWHIYNYSYDSFSKGKKQKNYTKQLSGSSTAFFENGLIHGEELIFELTYHEKRKKETYERRTYKNGILWGPCSTTEYGKLVKKGEYKNGKPSGEWFHYGAKFKKNEKYISEKTERMLLLHYTIPDSLVTRKSTIIRGYLFESDQDTISYYSSNGKRMPKNYFDRKAFPFLCFANEYNNNQLSITSFGYYYQIPNINIDPMMQTISEDRFPGSMAYQIDYPVNLQYKEPEVLAEMIYKRFTRQELIDSLGYQFMFMGVFEEYYPNGQLKFKFEVIDGVLLKEEPIYWDNGKIASEINYLPETKCYEEKLYLYSGEMTMHRIYDSKGKLLKVLKDKYQISPLIFQKENMEFARDGDYLRYYNNTYQNEVQTEKFILSETLYLADTSLMNIVSFDPATRTYIDKTFLRDGKSFVHIELVLDSLLLNYSGFKREKYGDLERENKLNGSITFLVNNPSMVNPNNRQTNLNHLYPEMNGFNLPAIWNKNGIPYTGKLELSFEANAYSTISKRKKIVITNKKYLERDNITYLSLLDGLFMQIYNDISYGNPNHPQKGVKITGSFLEGQQHGAWSIFNKKGQKIYLTHFDKGVQSGSTFQMAFPFIPSSDYPDRPVNIAYPDKPTWYLSVQNKIKNGKPDGASLTFDWKGDTTFYVNYELGIKEGKAIEFDYKLQKLVHRQYQNDTLEGKAFVLGKRNDTLTVMNYKHGKLDGFYQSIKDSIIDIRNYKADLIESQNILQYKENKIGNLLYSVKFDTIKLERNIISYHKNGKIYEKTKQVNGTFFGYCEKYDSSGFLTSKTILNDSFVQRHEFWNKGNLKYAYDFFPSDSLVFQLIVTYEKKGIWFYDQAIANPYPIRRRKGVMNLNYGQMNFTKYDENEIIKAKGKLINDKKSGLWNYYDSQGKLNYQLDYRDTSFTLQDSMFFHSTGIYFQLDSSGNVLSKSYVIEQSSQFDCTHDEHYEIRTFYTFWEKNPNVGRQNGFVKHYYDNGTLQSEGMMHQGLPKGIWKFYNPFGGLDQVGMYKNGLREGRWLSGDLTNVAYIGDFCIDPNTPKLSEVIREKERTLRIQIHNYTGGKAISSGYFVVDKN